MRVSIVDRLAIGDAHGFQHGGSPLSRLSAGQALQTEHLGDLFADANGRIQGARRVLIHHRDRRGAQAAEFLAAEREQVAAGNEDLAAHDASVGGQIAHGREGRRGFSAAGLAHQSVGFAGGDVKAEAAQHLEVASADAIGDIQVLHAERVHLRVHASTAL